MTYLQRLISEVQKWTEYNA